MSAVVDIQIASSANNIPSQKNIELWVNSAIAAANQQATCTPSNAELSIRIVDDDESQTLNRNYRQKDKPTNVLSFPAELDAIVGIPLLGDLVICAPIVEHEAMQQQKAPLAHWAHMVIHGTLHLLGYDHIDDNDATTMESLETQIIISLGLPAPYEV